MGEYFLQKIQYSFTLAILLTISIYFFVYHDSSIRIPQSDMYTFMGIIIFVLILNIITLAYHVRNTVERKEKDKLERNPRVNWFFNETVWKWIQHVTAIVILLVIFSFSAKYSKGGTVPKETSLALAIISLMGFVLTLIVFIWSFYGTNSRQKEQDSSILNSRTTPSDMIKSAV